MTKKLCPACSRFGIKLGDKRRKYMGPTAVSSCVQAQLARGMRRVLTKPIWWKCTGSGFREANLGNNIKASLHPGALDKGATIYVSNGRQALKKTLPVFDLENWHIIKNIRHVNPNPPRKTISMKVGAKNIDVDPEQYAKKMVEKYTGNV